MTLFIHKLCILVSDEHTYLIKTSYRVPKLRYIGLDSLYHGRWKKISKSYHDPDLDRTMPSVKLF